MRYAILAGTAALSSFAIVVAVLSAAVALWSTVAVHAFERYAPDRRAALLFRLRILPSVAASLFAFGIALPVFATYEPFETNESLPRVMMAIACVGAVLLARGVFRAVYAWRATARMTAAWKRAGRRVSGLDATIPVYAVAADSPIVAVAGMLRPALFVAERVLEECSIDEVRAMIAHETAHVRAFDNVRRLMIRGCPDLAGERSPLTRAWKDAAEEAADADAARPPGRGMDLAQALIRVARLAPPIVPALISNIYSGGSIDARVRRLLAPPSYAAVPILLRGWTLAAATGVLALAAVLEARTLQQAIELAVRLIP